MVPWFSEKDIEAVRIEHHPGKHDETTVLKDFQDFIGENPLTFPFKLIFMPGMLKPADREEEVDMDGSQGGMQVHPKIPS
jgi:hypothetical protein